MLAGNLNRKITINRKVETRDSFGASKKTLEPFKTLKAQVIYKSGYEAEFSDQLKAINTIMFVVRYTKEIDETMVIDYEGQLYDIRFISHDGRTSTTMQAERS